MKNIYSNTPLFLIAFLFASLAVSCDTQQKPSQKIVSEKVDQLLDLWHLSASKSNFEDYFNCLAEDAIFIGTDKDEIWDKKAFMAFSKPYFDDGKGWDFKVTQRNLYFGSEHTTIWFDELLDTWMGTCRGSGVIIIEDGKWKIKHYVLSLTIPNEKMDEVKGLLSDTEISKDIP